MSEYFGKEYACVRKEGDDVAPKRVNTTVDACVREDEHDCIRAGEGVVHVAFARKYHDYGRTRQRPETELHACEKDRKSRS